MKENKVFEIKQITLTAFNYPYIIAVKEGTEIFIFSVTTNRLRCVKLNMPILMEGSKERDYSNDSSIYCLIDHGACIKYGVIITQPEYIQISLYNRFYEKSNFPMENIIDAFGGITYKAEKEQQNGILLQFETCLLKFFDSKHGLFERVNLRLEKGEIINSPTGNGLLIWK